MEVLRDETTQRGFTWIQTAAGSTPSFSLESACLSSGAVSFAMKTYAGVPAVQRRERLRIAAPPRIDADAIAARRNRYLCPARIVNVDTYTDASISASIARQCRCSVRYCAKNDDSVDLQRKGELRSTFHLPCAAGSCSAQRIYRHDAALVVACGENSIELSLRDHMNGH